MSGAIRDAEPLKFIATVEGHRDGSIALEIQGNANNPRFREGDVVTIEPGRDAEPGQWVFVSSGGEYVFRRYFPISDSTHVGAELRAGNADYPRRVMTAGDMILGVMREHISTHHD